MAEHHKRLDNPEFTPETYHYTMSDDNKELIMVYCRWSMVD